MKTVIKSFFALAAIMAVAISCNGNNKSNESKNDDMRSTKNSKTLVVYFSHAGENYSVGNIKVGNTKLVADEIGKITGGDEFEIVAEKNYDMPYDDLTVLAKNELEKGERPTFKGEVKNIEDYDTIFIGGPIWWGTYPQVMFTFFDKYDLNGKTLILFSTHEGSGLGSVENDLKKLYPKANFKEAFSIYGHEVRSEMSKVDSWLKRLGY